MHPKLLFLLQIANLIKLGIGSKFFASDTSDFMHYMICKLNNRMVFMLVYISKMFFKVAYR